MKELFLVPALSLSLMSNVLIWEPAAQANTSPKAIPSSQTTPAQAATPAAQATPPPQPTPSPEVSQPITAPTPNDQEERDDVVRITTKLVQVDATVTDRAGKQVTNLTVDDFEITENGRPQKITNFSYVSGPQASKSTASGRPVPSPAAKDRAATVAPPSPSGPREEGMVYGLNVPVAKPGAYLLRIAVRDGASGRIGSAGQYIEVPNVNSKDRLVLSSLVISGNNPEGFSRRQWAAEALKSLSRSNATQSTTAGQSDLPLVVAGGEGMLGTEDPRAGPASRRFRSKMYLNFACLIYNNKKHTDYTSQVRLFHDGREVYVGQPMPLDLSQQTDMKRLLVARRVFLGTVLEPGDYILHLTVIDASSSGKRRRRVGWISGSLTNTDARMQIHLIPYP